MSRIMLVLPLIMLVAACRSEPLSSTQTADMVTGADMARYCPSTCASGCPAGEQCILPFGAGSESRAFCGRLCADDSGCAAGERCLVFFAAMQPAVCVSDTQQISCTVPSGQISCDVLGGCDGNVANVPFSDNARGFCGWERKPCPNGCTGNGVCNP